MAGEYNDLINRTGAAVELPVQLAQDLIMGTTKESAALSLGTKVQAKTLDNRIPVIETLPEANWEAQPDIGLAQTTDMAITNRTVLVHPLSTIALVPNDVINDSQYTIWDAIKPKLQEALAKKIDQCVLYGEGKPVQLASQPSALETAITASGGRLALDIATTLTSGNLTITDANAATTDVGLSVFGPGIPSGAVVASAVAGTSFTLNTGHAPTVSGKKSLMLLPSSAAYAQGQDVFNSSADNPSYVLKAAQAVAEAGYAPDGAITSGGWEFRSAAARTQSLVANPIGSDAPFNPVRYGRPRRHGPRPAGIDRHARGCLEPDPGP